MYFLGESCGWVSLRTIFLFMFLIFLPPGMLTLLDTKTSAWIAVIFTYMVSE